MQQQKVVSPEQWLAARKALLAKEKAFTRERDALECRAPRAALGQGRQDVCVRGPGRQGDARPSCSATAASCSSITSCSARIGPKAVRAARSGRTTTMASSCTCSIATCPWSPSREPRWTSSRPTRSAWAGISNGCRRWAATSTATITSPSRPRSRRRQSITTKPAGFGSSEAPGVSVFAKGADGRIFHTYSCYARGLDTLNGAYQLLDLVPKGRDEQGLSHSMAWLRRHDKYDT